MTVPESKTQREHLIAELEAIAAASDKTEARVVLERCEQMLRALRRHCAVGLRAVRNEFPLPQETDHFIDDIFDLIDEIPTRPLRVSRADWEGEDAWYRWERHLVELECRAAYLRGRLRARSVVTTLPKPQGGLSL